MHNGLIVIPFEYIRDGTMEKQTYQYGLYSNRLIKIMSHSDPIEKRMMQHGNQVMYYNQPKARFTIIPKKWTKATVAQSIE